MRRRVAFDVSPLVLEPRGGVARALGTLLAALRARADGPDVVPFAPRPGERASQHRRRLVDAVSPVGFDAFVSPWSAFPAVRVPVVVTVHELPFVRAGLVEGRLRAWSHRQWLAADVVGAARIVVPSVATRDDVLSLHPEAAPRVRVVPHGFDPAPWTAAARTPRRDATPYGVLVGARRARRKGVDVWRAAVARAATPRAWVVVGRPDGALGRALAHDPRVRVEDDLDDAALMALVAGARILVYPSRSEGFGYPPLEAMAAGVLVVTTTAGSLPEVVGDAAWTVAPGDAAALAAAIDRAFDDDALRATLVARGLARAAAFPPARAAAAFADVLEEAVAEGPR
ncbi:MAG: glycosyltransferase [Planctomycetes bacterium]|nr:glycosyltransferase [Planctomycetota bacterium]